jgi:hypothetical protein
MLLWGAMSEIPYYFETPVPKYFRESGWFECEHMYKFVTWAFSKCQSIPHKIVIQGKEITLQPFEFISGRLSSPKECFLTENILRNQQFKLQKAGLLKKTTNSLTNHYSCYIWVTERFCKINNQQNNQRATNRQPTDHHKSRREKIRYQEDHPSIPSFENGEPNRDAGLMTDDFSSGLEKLEVIKGVFLTPEELDACVKLKGDIETVKHAMEFIQASKRRKHAIQDWLNALATWKIENKGESVVQGNITYCEKLSKEFPEFENGHGWRCYIYHDRNKDQRGILFESTSAYQNPFFIALIDSRLREKSEEFIRNNQMRKK